MTPEEIRKEAEEISAPYVPINLRLGIIREIEKLGLKLYKQGIEDAAKIIYNAFYCDAIRSEKIEDGK